MKKNEFVIRPDKMEFLNETMKIVEGEKPQSVLISADEGSGKTFLINSFLKTTSPKLSVLFHFNPKYQEDNPYDFLYQIFYYMWNSNNENIKNVKQYFIQHTQGEINVLNKNVDEIFENSNYQYYYKIILDILKDFIFICSQYNKIIIVFENLQFYTKETKDWLFQLIKGINHPILTLFTTNNVPQNIPPEIQVLKLEPLNVKSVEKLIQHSLKSGEINAKFITNFVHIKSNGNPAYIINLINEIFKDETLYADDILEVNKVNPKELPSNWQEFWEYKWNKLENKENLEKVFYYLLLFPHEKSFTFWKGLFRTLKMVDEFKTLIEKRWLIVEKNMNEKWVYPYNSTLLDFIKLKISTEKIMSFVAKHKNKTLTDKIIPQLSYNSMLLDTFLLTAYQLTKIFEEIKKLIAYGRFQHAINIINTLVLSPEFEDLSKNNRIKILKLLAELFEYQGNYENAILHFQRLKDLIKPSEKELRSEINYHIGKNLFKIDKILEANILLKRVVEKDAPSSILTAKIYSVYGLIHFHNHQYQQAISFFTNSLNILKKEKTDNKLELLKADVCSQLAKVLRIKGDFEEAIEMLNNAQGIYVQQNEISNKLKVILHKSYIWYNYLDPLSALRNIMKEYFSIRHIYAPGIIEILQKQIAELYWLVGKWRFARQYYNRLFEFFSWRGDVYNASFMLGNMATISKEIGEFGDAARIEERALRLEHISQNTKAMVYSLQNLGHIYLVLGNYYNAGEQLTKALHLAEKNNLFNT